MSTLEELFAEIESLHVFEPCLDETGIDRFETQYGYKLPADLKKFYKKYDTVRLFDDEYGGLYHFVPVSEIHPTYKDIYGEDFDEQRPSAWFTICDIQDGNYIAIDLESENDNEFNYIDCFHETFAQPGECKVIAKSFTELLSRALRSKDRLYYFEEDFIGYGDGLPLTAENAAVRIENREAPTKGWLVKFSVGANSYCEFFADNDYGGKEKSFVEVRHYVEKHSNAR
jgi:cell wall assembly regulator SMI1